MNEDTPPTRLVRNVGTAREVTWADTEASSEPMKYSTDGELGRGVPLPDRLHPRRGFGCGCLTWRRSYLAHATLPVCFVVSHVRQDRPPEHTRELRWHGVANHPSNGLPI
jgi:hypothetical protein